MERIFTNYSGDISGRFLELAALTSPRGRHTPPTLDRVIAAVPGCQKADGHFGVAVDLSKPLAKGSAPIPMLWGNARLLVGLVACGQKFHDAKLLAAARRLGDFYVTSDRDLCSPQRLADYRSSGTYGNGYTCCYFPAIEGLAMLYRATKDGRYLNQAERMADWFQAFDALPIDHSHGNLCAWRGILMLYEITGKRGYLDRAKAKWEAAMARGFVWPIGGVGEHWYVSYSCDEGCSESDWLRFNLDLWRFTGNVRYLDVSERLLWNQYLANQSRNGGYGALHFDADSTGPIATRGKPEEWPWCCSFHGPLGLHFLKAYLAAGADRGIWVNFPVDFGAPIHAAGCLWQVTVHSKPRFGEGVSSVEIELVPQAGVASAPTTLRIRKPGWATQATAVDQSGTAVATSLERGYLRIERPSDAGRRVTVTFTRRFGGRTPAFFHLEPAASRNFAVEQRDPGTGSRGPLRRAAGRDGPTDVSGHGRSPGPVEYAGRRYRIPGNRAAAWS